MYKRITNRDIERYTIALSIAENSACRFQMGACIYLGARFISAAHNIIKTHPLHHTKYGKHVISIHAEHMSLIRARTDVRGATMYIARFSMHKNTSKPCNTCMSIMHMHGIREIVYTVRGELIKESLDVHYHA